MNLFNKEMFSRPSACSLPGARVSSLCASASVSGQWVGLFCRGESFLPSFFLPRLFPFPLSHLIIFILYCIALYVIATRAECQIGFLHMPNRYLYHKNGKIQFTRWRRGRGRGSKNKKRLTTSIVARVNS